VIREFSEDPDRMVITVDPRLSETARMSDMHVALRAGTDALFLRSLIALIIREGWQDQKFIDERVLDFEKVKSWFEGFDIEAALAVCNVPFEQAREFSKILATRNWGMHQDLGLFMGRHNTLNSYLALMLTVITGNALVKGGRR
jgi:anaerobic selenocysteine-containing dehydrogenase